MSCLRIVSILRRDALQWLQIKHTQDNMSSGLQEEAFSNSCFAQLFETCTFEFEEVSKEKSNNATQSELHEHNAPPKRKNIININTLRDVR